MTLRALWGFEDLSYTNFTVGASSTANVRTLSGLRNWLLTNAQAVTTPDAVWAATTQTAYAGFALYDDSDATVAATWLIASFGMTRLTADHTWLQFRVTTDRRIQMWIAISPTAAGITMLAESAPDLFVYQEHAYWEVVFKTANASGIAQLWKDGTLVLDFAGDTFANTGSVANDNVQIRFAAITGAGNDLYIDDIYICTSNTSGNDPWVARMGDISIEPLDPSTEISLTFTPTGSTNVVNVSDDDMATYNTSTGIDLSDRFGLPAMGSAGDPLGLKLSVRVNRQGTGLPIFDQFVHADGANQEVTNALTASVGVNEVFRSLHPVAPSAAAWTLAMVNAAEVSYRQGSQTGATVRVVKVQVELASYREEAPPPPTGIVSVFDGADFVLDPVFFFDGADFVEGPVRVWDGADWLPA